MPAGNSKILVLLAAYNGARHIARQIESILSQVGVDLRLVVHDDASRDSTAAAVTCLSSSDPRIELKVRSTPSGSAAQNFLSLIRANDAADFAYVALADQDDIWMEDKLHRAVAALAASGAAGYSSAVTAIWPNGRTRSLVQDSRITASDFLFEGAGQGCTFVMSAWFYRRLRTFLMSNEEKTRYLHFHDWAIYAISRIWNLGWTFDSSPTMLYMQHESNDTGARGSLKAIFARLSRIRRGWYRSQLLAISELALAADSSNRVVTDWYAILQRPASCHRRLMIAAFCMRGGRRRSLDNAVLVSCALLGWV